MTNKISCKKIDHLLYLTDDEMNSSELILMENHLITCPSCKKVREGFLTSRLAVLELNREIPDNTDFAESMLQQINSGLLIKSPEAYQVANPVWKKSLKFIRYASGAAAIFLLFLFVSEQTVSVHKISSLEVRIQSAIVPSAPGLIDRMTLARGVFSETEWQAMLTRMNVKSTNPRDLLQIGFMLEQQIRLRQINEPALINLFRNTRAIKRNTITLNNLIK